MRDSVNIGPRPWGGGTREVTDDFNQGIKDRLDGKDNWADAVANNCSPAEYRKLARAAVKDQEREAAQADLGRQIERFFQLRPEYSDCEHNSAAMNVGLRALGIDPTTATAEDFDLVFSRVRNSLSLKKDVLEKQAKAKVAEEIEAERKAATFDEEEAWSMPMDKLRQRAGGIF